MSAGTFNCLTMSVFYSIVKKETFHIFRDRRTLLILFGMPVIMIILFGYAIRNDVGTSSILVVDQAHDAYSARLISEIGASAYFHVIRADARTADIRRVFQQERASIALVLPPRFQQQLGHRGTVAVQALVDASDPNLATILVNYLQAIVQQFQSQVLKTAPGSVQVMPQMRMLYNPAMKSVYGFVPGLMTMILMLVSAMMTAITIVKEKETGTMEVLLVSPLQPPLIVLGKITPYIALAVVNTVLILLLGLGLFHVPMLGNWGLLALECLLFILTTLSLGILISTVTSSQQTAMMMSLAGLLMPTVLLSGFIFPLNSMPLALQFLANIIPAKWFILILKNIMLKGAGLTYVWKDTVVLIAMMGLFLGISVRNFKIRLD